MTVFAKTLYDRRRSLLAWSLGLVSLIALILAYWPSVRGNDELDRFIRELPEAVRALTGEVGLATPAGYLNGELFAFMVPVLVLVVAIGMGARAVAGEEERGTFELLLSMPISRQRVLLEKVAGGLVVLLSLGVVLGTALVVGARVAGMDIAASRLVAATVAVIALSLPFGALALLLGCITGARGASIGVTAAAAVAAYLLDALAPFSTLLAPYGKLSPFRWYDSAAVLEHGIRWGCLALLVALASVFVTAAAFALQQRDAV